MINFYFKKQKGFTLIELMVATSIFMVVMLAATGALMVASNSAREAKALRQSMDNVNYAMDTISRSLRLGSGFYCTSTSVYLPVYTTQDCSSGGAAIVFIPANTTTPGQADTMYRLGSIGATTMHEIERCDKNGNCVALTSPTVDITDLKFIVKGSGATSTGDFNQPNVFIMISGQVYVKNQNVKFFLQTLASQRNFE